MDKDLERQEIDLLSKSMSTAPVQYLVIMITTTKYKISNTVFYNFEIYYSFISRV